MSRRLRPVPLGSVVLLAVLLCAAARPARAATSSDVHLVHRFTIQQNQTPLVQEERHVYVHGTSILLQNPERSMLLRPDLQRVWLLDGDRQPIADLPLDQLKLDMANSLATLTPQGSLPPIQPSDETRSLHGLRCQMYRAATSLLTLEACVTRQLPGLERFQVLLGGPAGIPGVPIDFSVLVQPPTQSPVTIRQLLVTVDTTPLDPRLFVPPAGPTPVPPKTPR